MAYASRLPPIPAPLPNFRRPMGGPFGALPTIEQIVGAEIPSGGEPIPAQPITPALPQPTPVQQAAPTGGAAPGAEGMDWRNFFGEALQDLGYGMASSPDGQWLAGATQRSAEMEPARAEARASQKQENATLAAMRARGRTDLVEYIEAGGSPAVAYGVFLQDMADEKKQSEDRTTRERNAKFLRDPQVIEAYTSGQIDLKGAVAMETGETGTEETWGLTPQAYEVAGPDGKPTTQIGVMSNRGNFKPVPLPDGASPVFPVQQLNTGTGFTGVDKFGNPVGGTTPIDNFGAAQDSELGRAIGGEAARIIIGLPKTIATSNNMIATVDGILNDPALDISTGWLSWMQSVPGTDQFRFGQRSLQLQGQAFLQAFESLKGAGQITEVEGTKATQAIGRLSTAQNAADYRAALTELKGIIQAAKGRAISAAGAINVPPGAAIQPPPAPAPDAGATMLPDPFGMR